MYHPVVNIGLKMVM